MKKYIVAILLLFPLVSAAATATKLWTFVSDSQGWVATCGAATTCSWSSTIGNPLGSLLINTSGKNKSDNNFWLATSTWETFFGIPTGSTVTSVNTGATYDWSVTTCTTCAAGSTGDLELTDASGVFQGQIVATTTFAAATTTFATSTGSAAASVPSSLQPSASVIGFKIKSNTATGNSVSGNEVLSQDQVSVSITYSTSTPAVKKARRKPVIISGN